MMRIHWLSIAALLWAGMILGISFLESWVKFKTPTLGKLVGLEVGRTVFRSFQQVQLVFLILIIALYVFHVHTVLDNVLLGVLISVAILQVFCVFPILCQRIDDLATGKKLPHSYAHVMYGIGEVIKFIVLLVFGMTGY